MTEDKIIELQNGFNTAFINGAFNFNLAYRPQFIQITEKIWFKMKRYEKVVKHSMNPQTLYLRDFERI